MQTGQAEQNRNSHHSSLYSTMCKASLSPLKGAIQINIIIISIHIFELRWCWKFRDSRNTHKFTLHAYNFSITSINNLKLNSPLFFHKRLLVEMEGFKQQVAAVQQCQSALRLPEEVVASLPICRTAQTLQQEASQLQHTTIQQCNILQVKASPLIATSVYYL